ncbi:MAG: MBL fold metallo-hydrolase RNA specificity domain-containing protein [Bacteroidia bacterium]
MKIKFCGAARTVTGSSHLLTLDNGSTILLDCGLYQGREDELDDYNLKWEFDPEKIDLLVVSHAHIDHIGRIPKLVKDGFKGNIVCTHATRDLASLMLLDSASIQEKDAQWANEKNLKKGKEQINEPLYTTEDAKICMQQFSSYNYNRWFHISADVQVYFADAGHILGSASVVLKIVRADGSITHFGFTGDVGRWNRPIIKDPEQMIQVDYLISESTYGGETHDELPGDLNQLLDIVHTTCVVNQGKVIIPAFSVGRTQEIVYMLDHLESKGRLPRIPVYVDSPLAVNATDIFTMHHECFDSEIQRYMTSNDNPFGFNGLTYIRKVEESKALNVKNKPCIIISASGMANAGRIRHHIFNNIEDANNTILIVGYCAEGTLGARLRDFPITVKIFGKELRVRATIKIIDGLSGHADQQEMLKFLSNQNPQLIKKTFLVHGEYTRQQKMKYAFESVGFKNVFIPELGEEFPLE